MARKRFVLVVTLVALLAPWLAPCLIAAPASHAAMPCCHGAGTPAPAARPCCAPDEGDRSLPPTSTAGVSPLAMVPAGHAFLASLPVARPLTVQSRSRLPVEPRLLFAVLLI